MTSPLVCLVILDGWGLAPPGPGNAVELADTPTFDRLWAAYPHTQLDASGRAVGLPDGQMGNSEVGHTNLGAGRVVRQDLVRIDDDIESGAFFENPVLVDACRKARGSALHLLGLVSDGGVHSHLRHLRALIELASREDVEHVHVHAFTDGRDTSPHGGAEYLDGLPGVATVVGRYYAMDRDRRWDRAKRAYDAIVHGVGARADDAVEAVKASYAAGVTDEFIEPVVIGDPSAGRIRSGDAAIFFNFRPDRARELSWALTQAELRRVRPRARPAASPLRADDGVRRRHHRSGRVPGRGPRRRSGTGRWPATASRSSTSPRPRSTPTSPTSSTAAPRRRCAGEEWELVDSPRDVADLRPEAEHERRRGCRPRRQRPRRRPLRLLPRQLREPRHGRPHGRDPGRVEAVETADRCLARVAEAVAARGGVCLVTADHGNAETMLHPDGSPHTAHTTNPVPLIATDEGLALRSGGRLADIAPTVLDLLGLPAPAAMNGASLIERARGSGPGGWHGMAIAEPQWPSLRHPYGRVSILTRVFRTGSNTLALPQPDPDVLRLARRGDERAFAIIVRQYNGPVFNYVTRVLSGDRALAEDICQEVFMRVYQALPGLRRAVPVHDVALPGRQAPGRRRAARA